jgi:hypothetical protein
MLKCPMEVILLAMTHQHIMSPVVTHLQTTDKITRSYPIGLEWFQSDFETVF